MQIEFFEDWNKSYAQLALKISKSQLLEQYQRKFNDCHWKDFSVKRNFVDFCALNLQVFFGEWVSFQTSKTSPAIIMCPSPHRWLFVEFLVRFSTKAKDSIHFSRGHVKEPLILIFLFFSGKWSCLHLWLCGSMFHSSIGYPNGLFCHQINEFKASKNETNSWRK